ncbi:MAG: DUF429 domain-containing protein [Pyrobaculum sp.]
MIVAGVDLAVVRPTAVAVLEECDLLYLALASSDEEVVWTALLFKPRAVAIDAPLTAPEGGRGLRDVETQLRRLGYRLLPPMMGGMKDLTLRGIRLSKSMSADVVEVHPTTSLKAMGLSRRDVERRYGVKQKDLVDAIVAALTALAYVRGDYKRFGPFVLPTSRVCL